MQVRRFQHAISPEAQRILVSHPDRIFAQADARRSTAAVRPEQNSNAAESSARGYGSKAFQKWRNGWQIFVKRACTNNEDVHRLNVNTRIPVAFLMLAVSLLFSCLATSRWPLLEAFNVAAHFVNIPSLSLARVDEVSSFTW